MIVEQPNGSIARLDDKAIGRTVWYVPYADAGRSLWERGKIKSFDNGRCVAWVVYDNGNNSKVDHYQDYTPAVTNYDDLRFVR